MDKPKEERPATLERKAPERVIPSAPGSLVPASAGPPPERVGRGRGVAVLLNARARRVTPRVLRRIRQALPDALVLVSSDIAQAKRHAKAIAESRPFLVLCGGGDGTAARLLNLLRPHLSGGFPILGLLRLGTGNGWANSVARIPTAQLIWALPRLPRELPTVSFDLVEVEGTLSPFAGLGWDARILNDYLRVLDRRSGQIFASRLATRAYTGLPGYLFALATMTIPEELADLRSGIRPQAWVEAESEDAFELHPDGRLAPAPGRLLFEGPASAAIAGTEPEYGFGLKAFPNAGLKPGYVNVRVYEGTIAEALRALPSIWFGRWPLPRMREFFVKAARVRFSRPMPFQIAGDAEGMRDEVTYRVAPEQIRLLNTKAALASLRAEDLAQSPTVPAAAPVDPSSFWR